MCLYKNSVLSLVALLAIATFFTSCKSERPSAGLYPIDSVLSAQISFLREGEAVLYKTAIVGAQRDTVSYHPKDSTSWSGELDIFRQLEMINKPINRGNYSVQNSRDQNSNLNILSFSTEEMLPVRSLEVYYTDNPRAPRKIKALYQEQNALYESERILQMEFEKLSGRLVLVSYSIQGGQQMILADSVAYTINGEIQFQR